MAQTVTDPPSIFAEDLEILTDPPVASREPLRWAWLFAPWTWFVFRGVHPWMEIVAILLPVLLVTSAFSLLLLAAYRRSAVLLGVVLSILVVFVIAVVAPMRPITTEAPVDSTRFASINLAGQWFSDNEVGFFVHEREPDVFVGMELREPLDTELRNRFDHAVTDLAGFAPDPVVAGLPDFEETYRRNDFPSIGLYSRFPITRLDDPIADTIPGGLPGFRALLETDHGNIIVYALHVPRPGRGSGIFEIGVSAQHDMLEAIAEAVEAEDLPVVVIGDLNIVDRGPGFGDLSDGMTDAMRVDRWAGATRKRGEWHMLLQLRIDHLLMSDGLCAENAKAPDLLYTDHTPIQADVGPCPAT